jgi:beta-RFAP synthase
LRVSAREPVAVHRVPKVSANAVRVEAPARLHLGFLDPSATLGRRFGSIGVTISRLETVVEMEMGDIDRFEAADDFAAQEIGRAQTTLAALRAATGIERALHVTLHRTLPAHAGFGSGTQLALAIGQAFCAVHEISLGAGDIASGLARGGRSGIGIGAFLHGGVLVDGGHDVSAPGGNTVRAIDVDAPRGSRVPPILARLDFPDAWRAVLVIDERLHGLHGGQEAAAIAALPAFAASKAAALCHEILMRVLPAIAEHDFARFAEGVTRLQEANGAYFAAAQGGRMFVSESVARVLSFAQARFGAAIGQSSWGPTGFAFVDSEAAAEALTHDAVAAGNVDPHVRLVTVSGRNHGARVVRSAEVRRL